VAKRIGFLNQKGGGGKTTMSLAVSAAALAAGRRVLLVGCDPQGSIRDWADARKRVGLDPVEGLTVEHHPFADVHAWLPGAMKAAKADVAIMDGAPLADADLSRSIIAAADRIIVPVRPSFLDLWASRPTLALIREAKENGLKIKAAIALSQVKPGTNIGRDFAQLVKEEGFPVLPAGTVDRVAYAEAMGGMLITEYEPTGKASDEAKKLLTAIEGM